MAKKDKEIKEVPMSVVEKAPAPKKIHLKRALSVYRKADLQRGQHLEDSEAIELFVKRYIPSLEATQEEFNRLLDKY